MDHDLVSWFFKCSTICGIIKPHEPLIKESNEKQQKTMALWPKLARR